MFRNFLLLIFSLISIRCASQSFNVGGYQVFDLHVNTSIRAIEVLNDSVVWFAGSGGVYGFTHDGGKHWAIDSMKIDSMVPDFRSMAVTGDHTVLLLNAGSPAYILKTVNDGRKWKRVYENHDPHIFFDSMKFKDDKNGIAVGDPIDSCFQIFLTHDGGETWQQVLCKQMPFSFHSMSCFASSNTCVDWLGNNIWIGTGGTLSAVLFSKNNGYTWGGIRTPLRSGSDLSGIFSLDFYNGSHGIIVGGNYAEKDSTQLTVATTGISEQYWEVLPYGKVPFGSCVQYQPNSGAKNIFIACLPGIYTSSDAGKNWLRLRDENGKKINDSYYTFRFSPSGKVAWFAGANGKVASVTLK